MAKKTKLASTKPVSTKWLKNAMRSIGVSTRNVLKEMAPNTFDAVDTGVNASKSIIGTLRHNAGGMNQLSRTLQSNKYVQFAQTAYKNALSDLKSGNLNNDQRFAESMFNDSDMGDIDSLFDDSGFTFGDDGADSMSVNIVNASGNNDAMFAMTTQLQKQTEATLKTSHANMNAMIAMNSASMTQIQQIGSLVVSGLDAINKNISSLVEYNNSNMNKFIESSLAFYERMGTQFENNSASGGDQKIDAGSIVGASGGINFGQYKQYVKQQFKKSDIGFVAGMIDDDMLKMAASNPLGFATEGLVRFMIPKMLTNTIKGVEETYSAFMPALLSKLSKWGEGEADGMIGQVKKFIGKTFGLKIERKDSIDKSASITKGPIPFDGQTKHAITEIITKELREQTSYLKAIAEHYGLDTKVAKNKAEVFDYKTGNYITTDKVGEEILTEIKDSIVGAFNSTTFGKTLRDSKDKIKKAEHQDTFEKVLDQFSIRLEQLDDIADWKKALDETVGHKDLKKHIEKTIQEMVDKDPAALMKGELARIKAQTARNKALADIEADPYSHNLFAATDFDGKNIDSKLTQFTVDQGKAQPSIRGRVGFNKETTSTGELNKGGGAFSQALHETSQGIGRMAAGLLSGKPDQAFAEFSKTIGQQFSKLWNTFHENFLLPMKVKLIGTKDKETGFSQGGIFSGVINSFKDAAGIIKHHITGKSFKDSKGNMHEATDDSVIGSLKSIGKSIKDGVMAKLFGTKDVIDEKTKEVKIKGEKGILSGFTDSIKDGIAGWRDALFGTPQTEKDKEDLKKSITEKVSEIMPNAATGSLIGAGVGMLSGGGLLGTLIGGPIGGIAMGAAAGIASKSTKFQDWLFGVKNDNGERTGGFISKKVQDFAKENKTALVGGAAIGSITGALGMTGGGILGTLVGGPLAGAVMGLGTAIIAKSKTFKEFLLGNEETGQTGFLTHLKNAFSFKKNGKEDPNASKEFGMNVLGAGAGAMTAALIGKMGILGASLTPFGPIGGALVGLGLSIKAQGGNFREWLFGKKDAQGKKVKEGVLGRFGNMINVSVLRPLKTGMANFFDEAKFELKYNILDPIRFAVEPVANGLKGFANSIKEKVSGLFGGIADAFKINIIDKVNDIIITPIRNVVSGITKVMWGVAKRTITAPFKLLDAGVRILTNGVFKGIKDLTTTVTKKILGFLLSPFKLLGKAIGKTADVLIKKPLSLLGNITNKLGDVLTGVNKDDKTLDPEKMKNMTERQRRAYEKKIERANLNKTKRERGIHDKNAQRIAKILGYDVGSAEDTEINRRKAEEKLGKKIDWRLDAERPDGGITTVGMSADKIGKANFEDLSPEGQQTSVLLQIRDWLKDKFGKGKDDKFGDTSNNEKSTEDSTNDTTADGSKKKRDVSNQRRCPNCKGFVGKDATHCKKCGAELPVDKPEEENATTIGGYLKKKFMNKFTGFKTKLTSDVEEAGGIEDYLGDKFNNARVKISGLLSRFKGKGHAKGTNDTGDEAAVVGENGPELVNFSKGNQVFANSKPLAVYIVGMSHDASSGLLTAGSEPIDAEFEDITDNGIPELPSGNKPTGKPRICPHCGHENPPRTRKCKNCGQMISQKKDTHKPEPEEEKASSSATLEDEIDAAGGLMKFLGGKVKTGIKQFLGVKFIPGKKVKKPGEEPDSGDIRNTVARIADSGSGSDAANLIDGLNGGQSGEELEDDMSAAATMIEADKRKDSAIDKAYTAAELQERKDKEEEKARLASIDDGIHEQTEEQKKHNLNWASIFSKDGLITAGLLLASPLIIKAIPTIVNVVKQIWPVVKKIGTVLGNFVTSIFDKFGWTIDNGALGDGDTMGDKVDEVGNRIKGVVTEDNFILNEDNQWDHQSRANAKLIPAVAGDLAIKSGKGLKGIYNWGKTLGERAAATMAEKTAKETAEAGAEKVVKEAAETGATKVVKEVVEAGTEKIVKEAAEEGAEVVVKKGGSKLLTSILTKIGSFADDICKWASKKFGKKKVGKAIFKKLLDKLSKVLAKHFPKISTRISAIITRDATLMTAGNAAFGAGIVIKATMIGLEGINGATGTARLFQVDQEYVDGLMTTISTFLGGFKGTMIGSILDVINEVWCAVTGTDLFSEFAILIYNAISNDENAAKLVEGREKFQDKYLAYQDEELTKQYTTAKNAGLISEDLTYDQYKEKVQSGEMKAKYDSFTDYNDKQHKDLGAKVGGAFVAAGKWIGNGIGAAGSFLFGKNQKHFEDANGNKYYDNKDGTYQIISADGTDLGYISKEALPEGLIEKSERKKGFFEKAGNAIGGAFKTGWNAVSGFFADKKKTVYYATDGSYYDSEGKHYSASGEQIGETTPDELKTMITSGILTQGEIVKEAGIKALGKSIGNEFKKLGAGIAGAWGKFTNWAGNVGTSIKDGATKLWNKAGELGNKLKTGISNFFTTETEDVYYATDGSYYDAAGKHYATTGEELGDSIDLIALSSMIANGSLTPGERVIRESGMSKLGNSIKDGIKKLGDGIAAGWKKFTEGAAKLGTAIKDGAIKAWNGTINFFKKTGASIKNFFVDSKKTVYYATDGSYYDSEGKHYSASGEQIGETTLEELESMITSGVLVQGEITQDSGIKKLGNSIKDGIKKLGDGIAAGWKKFTEGAAKLGSSIKDGATKLWNNAMLFVKDKATKVKNFFTDHDEVVWFDAEGGYYKSNGKTFDYYNAQGDKIGDPISAEEFTSIKDTLTEGTIKVDSGLKTTINKVTGAIKDGWNKFKEGAAKVANTVKEKATAIWNKATAFIKDKATKVKNFFVSHTEVAWYDAEGGYYRSNGSTFDYYNAQGDKIGDPISAEEFESIKDTLTEGTVSVNSGLKTIINNVTTTIKDTATKAWNKAKEVANTVKEKATAIWNKAKSFVTGKVDAVKTFFVGKTTTAWYDADGGYYVSNGTTFDYYNAQGDKIAEGVPAEDVTSLLQSGNLTEGTIKTESGLKTLVNKIGDSLKSTFNSIKDKATAAFNKVKDGASKIWNNIKENGLFGSIKNLFKKEKTIVWYDPNGNYYKLNGETYDYYNANNDLISSGIDAEEVQEKLTAGLLTQGEITEDSEAKKAINKIKDSVAGAWKKAKDTVASGWSKFTSWLTGGKGNMGSIPESSYGDQSFMNSSDDLNTVRNDILSAGNGRGRRRGGRGLPYYSQNDSAWANNPYGSDGATMSDSGCGPTVMAMVTSGLTGKQVTPMEMAGFSEFAGTRDSSGTNANFIDLAANAYGINSTQMNMPDASNIYSAAAKGPVVLLGQNANGITNPFTDAGHYVVTDGVDSSGNIIVKDPRGFGYNKKYSVNQLANTTSSMWGFGNNPFGGMGKRLLGGRDGETDDTTGATEPVEKKSIMDIFSTMSTFFSDLGTRAMQGLATGKWNTDFSNLTDTSEYVEIDGDDTALSIWNYYKSMGVPDTTIAGILANMRAESGLNPKNLQNSYEAKLGYNDNTYTNAVDNGSYTNFIHDAAGYGLVQWTYHSLKQALYNYAKQKGKSIGDIGLQLEFLHNQLRGDYPSTWEKMIAATSPEEASTIMLNEFEKPAVRNTNTRAGYAKQYYELYGGSGRGRGASIKPRIISTPTSKAYRGGNGPAINSINNIGNSNTDYRSASSASNYINSMSNSNMSKAINMIIQLLEAITGNTASTSSKLDMLENIKKSNVNVGGNTTNYVTNNNQSSISGDPREILTSGGGQKISRNQKLAEKIAQG